MNTSPTLNASSVKKSDAARGMEEATTMLRITALRTDLGSSAGFSPLYGILDSDTVIMTARMKIVRLLLRSGEISGKYPLSPIERATINARDIMKVPLPRRSFTDTEAVTGYYGYIYFL
ncbi:hypothetical protein SDC9_154997 [bioreactor metagenome]|uniref:Uncharacterized protein n=1 Tax=bioreactor metagenome TaxID=1076179 RepID=A0A645F240_9ZZZZ